METLAWTRALRVRDDVDVLVAGGGPAGIAATIAAARLGARVLLVEQMSAFGGLSTVGRVPAFAPMSDGENLLVGGIGRELVERLRAAGGTGPDDKPDSWAWIRIRTEALKRVYDALLEESGAVLRLCSSLADVRRHDDCLTEAVLVGKQGPYAIRAKLFIDATGDAILSFLAGARCELGDENARTQAPTLCSVFAQVDWEKYHRFQRDTRQGNNLPQTMKQAIADNAFTEPDLHLPGAFRIGMQLAGMNAGHLFGTNCTQDDQLTVALITARRKLVEYLAFYRKYVPGFECAELAASAALLGVRETRRVVGEYVLTADDFTSCADFADEIGRFNYPIDIHCSTSSTEEYQNFEDAFLKRYRLEVGQSYGIPYRSLVAKGLQNLLVAGRCFSTDREIQGSTRVIPCCFITGQAAGTAAALCAGQDIPARQLDPDTLRAQLRKDGAYIPEK